MTIIKLKQYLKHLQDPSEWLPERPEILIYLRQKEVYDSNYGAVLPEDIEVLGETIKSMKANDFKLCRKGGDFYFINPKVTNFLRELIAPSPTLIPNKCVSCGRCRDVCPESPKAIEMVIKENKEYPEWDMKKCIRCFCCQELCPVGAIEIKQGAIGRIINKTKGE
jgi:ferredoxin